MFSALMNAQNKVGITLITSVTWSIAGPTNSTYTGSAQSVTVVSVSPPGATYGTATNPATNAGSIAFTVVVGIGNYSGSFTSPILTITKATISGTAASPSVTYNAVSQNGTVITGVSPVGATFSGSVTASGTNAGTYTSSITGTGNYTGTVNGGTFTINARALTLASSGSTTLSYNDGSQTVGYTVNNIPAGGGGAANYAVYGVTGSLPDTYTATLDANTNYSVGTPSSFEWYISGGTLSIALSTINIPNIKGDPIYYIQYYRYNGPNDSTPTVHESWGGVTTTDFGLPLQSWTTSPNGWGAEPKIVDFYIYNANYYNTYFGSRYIPS